MRSTTTWLLGCAMAWALASCSGDSAGPCTRQSDCGSGQRCDPDLGCVPATNGGGDTEACAALEAGGCQPDPCVAEGTCDHDCAPDDPDCSAQRCPERCGPVPETAGESCAWYCSEGDECILQPEDPGVLELCEAADAAAPRDEDCDGLADCDDPDCEGSADCQ